MGQPLSRNGVVEVSHYGSVRFVSNPVDNQA